MATIDFNRINTNRGNANSALLKFRKTALKTPQLGVAKRSPVPSIEDQDCAIGRKQIRQRH